MLSSTTPLNRGEHVDLTDLTLVPFDHVCKLGAGVSAVVELVKAKSSSETFAHKYFRQYYGPELKTLNRAFKNEIAIIKRLHSHPHIIQLYWSYTCGRDLGMLLLPIASDGDLRAYLRKIQDTKEPPTSEQYSVLCRAFGCLAGALTFIHSHTIRHKDIKPQNILVHENRMIFTDFGIALDASDQDSTTTTGIAEAFTDRYRAPEVASHNRRNRKSDVFSLGCVYVEIMAVLVPEADMGAANKKPYWQRADDVRKSLFCLSKSDSSFDDLFLICSSMLEPESSDRVDAEAVLRHVQSIPRSQLKPLCELICSYCDTPAFSAPQDVTDGEDAAIMLVVETAASEVEEQTKFKDKEVEFESEQAESEENEADSEEGETDSEQDETDSEEDKTNSKEDNAELDPEQQRRSLYDSTLSPFQPERCLGNRVDITIRRVASRPLREHERGQGYIYIRPSLHPDYVTISRSGRHYINLNARKTNCNHYSLAPLKDDENERVFANNAARVEKLAFSHLMKKRFTMACIGCGRTHYNAFHTTLEHAVKVIKNYSNWTAEDPYQSLTSESVEQLVKSIREVESTLSTEDTKTMKTLQKTKTLSETKMPNRPKMFRFLEFRQTQYTDPGYDGRMYDLEPDDTRLSILY
jgi:serine/threonine protein kinase